MSANVDVYREIIRTIAKVLSGISLSLGSFISVVNVIALSTPDNIVRFGGYDIAVTSELVFVSVAFSFSFLVVSCLVLTLLFLFGSDGDDISPDQQS